MSTDQDNTLTPPANRWLDRLAELELGHWFVDDDSASHQDTLAVLKERAKELKCVYSLSQMMDRADYSVDDFLARAVDVFPPTWQFPEVACARIEMGSKTYKSLFYKESPWQLTSAITYPEGVSGQISIIYSEARPASDEGPFLKEERIFLDAVAARLARFVDQKLTGAKLAKTIHQLAIEKTALREANAALRLILDRIEEEKDEVELNIMDNMNKILLPIVRELSLTVPSEQKEYVNMLAENLGHITSPFVRKLSLQNQALTTTEVQICDLVRSGIASKEIASLRGISTATVNRHRENIRKKVGISNRKINLATFLRNTL